MDYRERDFIELVDEDKRDFVLQRVLSTLTGGIRC